MALPMPNERDICELLCTALGLNPDYVKRVVLDVNAGHLVMVYVEMYASYKMLDIDWGMLGNVEIKILDKAD